MFFSEKGFKNFMAAYQGLAKQYLDKGSPYFMECYHAGLDYDWEKKIKETISTFGIFRTFIRNPNGDVLFENSKIDWDPARPEIQIFEYTLKTLNYDDYIFCNKTPVINFYTRGEYHYNSFEFKSTNVIISNSPKLPVIRKRGFHFVFTEEGYKQFQDAIDNYYKNEIYPALPFSEMARLIDNTCVIDGEHHITNQDNFNAGHLLDLIEIMNKAGVPKDDYFAIFITRNDLYTFGEFYENKFSIRNDVLIEHLPIEMTEIQEEETGPSMN